VILRMLREPDTGRPAPLAKLLAVLVVVALFGITGPVLLLPVVGWLLTLL
jgi:hypothetical protein